MPAAFTPSLTVVVPVYNECGNLPHVLDELVAYLRGACRAFEVLLVDDGSTDGSIDAAARALGGLPPEVRVVVHPHNQGLTAALRTGFFGAKNEFVTWVPADGQIPARELGRILDAWHGEDLVLSTYRHRPDGLKRKILSRGLRVLLFVATGFRDRLEGTYLFRRALLDEFELVSRRSAGSIGFEIGAKARAFKKRVTSTEIECAPRISGASKVVSAGNISAYLVEIWNIRRSLERLRARDHH